MGFVNWTAGANKELQRIKRKYALSDATYESLIYEAAAWADRRIADADTKGYDDDPREVTDSDVGYAWAYIMMTMR